MLAADMNPSDALVVGDAHVHVHACYDRARFFDAAYENLRRAVSGSGETASPWHGVLLLSEAAGEDFFGSARGLAADARIGEWSVLPTDEPESLALAAGERRLVLIAGRQISCAEDLELLALASAAHFQDGAPIRDTLARVRASGALPVVPWGAGKWLFARGRLLDALLQEAHGTALFLGDESARPVLWPLPRHFRSGAALGIRNLPGSDPLPFPREQTQAGRYGFRVHAPFDVRRPAGSLRTALSDRTRPIDVFGNRETLGRFLRNQVAMQRRKRARRASV